MAKLQHISGATILLILSLTSIDNSSASIIPRTVQLTAIAIETIETDQLAQKESDDEMLDGLQERQGKIKDGFGKIKKLTGTESQQPETQSERDSMTDSSKNSEKLLPSTMAFRMLTVGLPATILVFLLGKPIVKGLSAVFKNNYQENFGKPKVPEGSENLHARSLKEITRIGNQAEKINNEKFGNEEFLLLLRIKINMAKEAEGHQGLGNCVDLLQAGIIAQKSFLRLEQTELRYRSRKQQEFYRYVAENLEGEIDKEAFVQKIEQKKTAILPLITTEEGRDAIDAYTKELYILGQYKLGLKLLSLFKQYELKDFSVLKNVSNIVETFSNKDLAKSDDLVSPVLENYESFEKLGPIIGISAAESTPKAYARILQVIGLTNRHGKAYLEFDQLVQLLKKWETLYKAIALVRQEYTEDKYSVPAEFKQDIPGWNTYQKYAEYLPDL
ncbi:MAG: hypothetical protein HC775_02715 [Hyellaceae cyanobacterium CSU_1_1]|nr:hypothetical protein [Hyellaceae cyanobacterium CSU_1_1]